LPCLKQEAAACLASTVSRIELVALGVKLRLCECAGVDHRDGRQATEIKKKRRAKQRGAIFYFLAALIL
jgi:hypothetical protein